MFGTQTKPSAVQVRAGPLALPLPSHSCAVPRSQAKVAPGAHAGIGAVIPPSGPLPPPRPPVGRAGEQAAIELPKSKALQTKAPRETRENRPVCGISKTTSKRI